MTVSDALARVMLMLAEAYRTRLSELQIRVYAEALSDGKLPGTPALRIEPVEFYGPAAPEQVGAQADLHRNAHTIPHAHGDAHADLDRDAFPDRHTSLHEAERVFR